MSLGRYRGMVLFVGDEELCDMMRETFRVFDLGMYNSERYEYFMLHRTELERDTKSTSQVWRASVTKGLASVTAKTLYEDDVDRVIVSVQKGNSRGLMKAVAWNTDVVAVLDQPMIVPTFEREFTPNAVIPDLISQVSEAELRLFLEYLTGEAIASNITTRNSYSVTTPTGILIAQAYIQNYLIQLGFQVELHSFRNDMANNIVAVWPGQTGEIVVLGTHYDSRGTLNASPTQPAPGANDDGSGTAMLLEIARIISASGALFSMTIHLNFYAGEEQGLIGSGVLAQRYLDRNEQLAAMLQADMTAYRLTGQPELAIPFDSATDSLVDYVTRVVGEYVPELPVGRTTVCCSDQRSFFQRGFPALQFFENTGPIQDPQYHNSNDVVNRAGFSFLQMAEQTKALLAVTAELAEVVN
eukprot:TRINITY_DN97_c1_g1_i1.p1 TRINITY_DN97_c1_g1~~TRINITY_DN97_c1_g1_i1.p1  ORF type:complete len:413 (-),score=91.61 TRINITY_DN97_c1_g1_i1:155-1393(-)